MPYGIRGGDTPAKDKKMEERVSHIRGGNPHMPKGEAVAIAKIQLGYGSRHAHRGGKK